MKTYSSFDSYWNDVNHARLVSDKATALAAWNVASLASEEREAKLGQEVFKLKERLAAADKVIKMFRDLSNPADADCKSISTFQEALDAYDHLTSNK